MQRMTNESYFATIVVGLMPLWLAQSLYKPFVKMETMIDSHQEVAIF